MRKEKRICPICGHKDTYVIWKQMFENKPLKKENFCCHHCGYFLEIRGGVWEDEETSVGIAINPRLVPLRRQFTMFKRALKKKREILEGLRIWNHFPYTSLKK